jgi:signal transduction histidine kinase/ligand-binding sensor domain-containing protein
MGHTTMRLLRQWGFALCWLLGNMALADPLLPPVHFRIEHIGVANGLTQGSVYFMHKDSRGFMWFGTQDGLNRYDGQRFLTYRAGDRRTGSLRGDNVLGIVEDPSGNLWIGTEEGLNRYDRLNDRFTCFYTRTSPAPGSARTKPTPDRVLPFYADANELLYLSDAEGLVSANYHTQTKRVLDPTLKPSRDYDLQSSTVRTPVGDVWLHAESGLVRYNLAERKAYRYFSSHAANIFGSPQRVFSFFIDQSNVAWIGTANGLIRFDYRAGIARAYPVAGTTSPGPIYSIDDDTFGRLWLGTQQRGILYFDIRTRLYGTLEHPGEDKKLLSRFEISKLFVDNHGIVWANIDPDGVVKLVPDAFVFSGIARNFQAKQNPEEQQLSNYTIRGFAEYAVTPADRQRSLPPLWVGNEAGIDVLDPQTGQVLRRYLTHVSHSSLPMHNAIKKLYVDDYSRMWVGTFGGAYLFHPRDESFELLLFDRPQSGTAAAGTQPTNYARTLVTLSPDSILAATENGLYLLSLAQRRWVKRPELANKNLFAFHWQSGARRLWVGTYLNGFVCYQLPPPGSAAPWQQVLHGLPGHTVLHFHDDPARNTVWMGTDRGLAALNRANNQIRLYTERDGLANSFVYSVLTDSNNNLWMSTNRGISRFDVNNANFKNFGLSDGLQGLEFNGNAYLRAKDGSLYFGGINGFNFCHPERYHSTRTNPSVYFYNLRVNEEAVEGQVVISEQKELTLNPSENTFSLEFSALDYLSNGSNRYAYKLTGYDADWVEAGERNYVRYANVSPGTYTLEVRAANKDGHWSNRVQRLTIRIDPPFWRTVPFVLALILALSAIVYYWVRRREELIRQQQSAQLRLSFDVQEQVKKDIARDLHDEIGTRLATLKLYTTQMARYAGDDDAPRSLRNAINGLINDTISDVRDLLRELNPRTLEQYGFGPALEELLERITNTGAIQTHLVLEEHMPRLPTNTETMLYRIVQELVNNTLKHANATQIDITCRYREDRLQLTYADNGQGFSYEKALQGLGIGNIESRVAMLQGTIQWQTEAGKGTSVLIFVPLPYADGKTRRSQTSIKIPSVSGG